MFKFLAAAALVMAATPAAALEQEDVLGTWKLVGSTKTFLDTKQVVNSYGAHPVGFITYGRDGRMMTVAAFDGRPKAASIDKISDAEKAKLFSTMFAYTGTYTIAGNSIIHHIDASWNEVWTGTDKVRDVQIKGHQLIYTTKPQMDLSGRMVVLNLVWEKWTAPTASR